MSFDEYGYPTEETLTQIREFDLGKRFENLCEFVRIIKSHWEYADWGFIYHPETGCLELHTAGWSGNESIIEAVKEQKWFWVWFWHKSVRGGHYYFKLYQFDNNGNGVFPNKKLIYTTTTNK